MSIVAEIIKEKKFYNSFRKSLMSAQKKVNAKTPREDDPTPDFILSNIEEKDTVTHSKLRGKTGCTGI